MRLRTVPETAEQLRLSDRAVYELCQRRQLRHLRLGSGSGAIRIAQADIDAYKVACLVGGKQKGTLSDLASGLENAPTVLGVSGETSCRAANPTE